MPDISTPHSLPPLECVGHLVTYAAITGQPDRMLVMDTARAHDLITCNIAASGMRYVSDVTLERAQAELAQAREVLSDCATTLEGYARHHAERGPEHAHKVARNAELAARCRAALAAKGE